MPSVKPADRSTRLLAIYLNDHLAGSTLGAELARRLARKHRNGALGADLAQLAAEISQDRRMLLLIMRDLGVPARWYKVYGGWAGEKLARLKLNGQLAAHSELSTLIELETLRLGVEGKLLMWRTLLTAAAAQQLDTGQLDELARRARAQAGTLETLRSATAATLFAASSRSEPAGSS